MADTRADTLAKLGDLAASAGLRRIHMLAWRDLADVEAGGSELHATTVARLWAEAGIEVTIRTSYAQGHPPESHRDGVHVIRRAGRYLVFPRAIVSEMSGRHGPRDGLVEIWNGMPFWSPLWATGPRVVFLHHVHGAMWKMVLPAEPRDVRRDRGEAHRSPDLPAQPHHHAVRLVARRAHPRAEVRAVTRLGRASRHRSALHARRRDPEKSEAPLVVAVGRLMPVKRFDELIKVMAEVRRTHPTVQLTIVGDGAERENLEALVADLDASEWVSMPGRLSDDALVELYRRAWVLASASAAEGWGMTVTEAAACGTPAVVTDIAGHRDAVQSGVTGMLVSRHGRTRS